MSQDKNELAIASVKSLILKFALPSVIAFLVNSLYSIVDQKGHGDAGAIHVSGFSEGDVAVDKDEQRDRVVQLGSAAILEP